MAALTWRNVDAPDASQALQGYGQFSQLLDRAFGGATDALTEFDNSKIEQESNEFITKLLTGYAENPDQFNEDLSSGKIMEGFNAKRLNAEARSLLRGRAKELLDYETGEVDLTGKRDTQAHQQWERGEQKVDRTFTLSERENEVASRALAARVLADPENAAAIMAEPEFKQQMAKLPQAMQLALVKDPLAIIEGRLSNEGKQIDNAGGLLRNRQADFDYNAGTIRFQNEVVDRQESRAGVALGQKAIGLGFDAESAFTALESDPTFQKAPAAAQAIARKQVADRWGVFDPMANLLSQDGAGGSGGGSAGGGGGGGAQNLVPDGTSVIKQIFGNAANVTSGYRGPDHALSKKNPKSYHANTHAAVDMKPIPGMTFAQAKKKIEAQGFTLVEAINEVGKGKTKHATGNHWHFVLANGGGIENGPPKASVGARAGLRAQDTNKQINTMGDTQKMVEAWGNLSNSHEAATALRGTKDEPGPFMNVPHTWLSKKIQELVDRSVDKNGVPQMNHSEAARAMHNALTLEAGLTISSGPAGVGAALKRYFDGNPNLGNGYRLNQAALDKAVSDAKSGKTRTRAERMVGETERAESVQAAKQAFDAADARWRAFQRLKVTNPAAYNASLDSERAKRQAAHDAFKRASAGL
jgi:hypothetical protein